MNYTITDCDSTVGMRMVYDPNTTPWMPVSIMRDDPEYLTGMISSRMRWDDSHPFPITALKNGERVAVMVFNDGQEPIVLMDEYGLFPSDALVTKLRLLKK